MVQVRLEDTEQFDFGGLLIRDLTAGQSLSASVAHIDVPAGTIHPKAKSTRSDKYYVCICGSVEFKLGDREVKLAASDLLAIPANEWFEYRNDSGESAHMVLFHVPPFDLDCEVFAE